MRANDDLRQGLAELIHENYKEIKENDVVLVEFSEMNHPMPHRFDLLFIVRIYPQEESK